MTSPRCYGLNLPPILLAAAIGLLPCTLTTARLAAAGPTASSASPTSVSETDKQNERIAALIKDLGSQQYLVRQHAQEDLRRLGPVAFDALAAAETDRDIEIVSRVRYLLQLIRVDWVRNDDSPVVKRILQDYEFADETQRASKLEELARQPQEIGLEALCRLVRFEQSPIVSKQGALFVLQQKERSEPNWRQARQKIIETSLTGSQRPGARWLLATAQLDRDPRSALDQWQRLIEAELASTSDSPNPAELAVTQLLQLHYAGILYRQSLPDQAKVIVRRIIETAEDDADSLEKLVEWLVEQQAFEMIDELARRFEHRLNSSPDLLYAMAQARLNQGKPQDADQLASRAGKLLGDDPQKHYKMAFQLRKRGLFDWSEREYRDTLHTAGKQSEWVIEASIRLSDLLFDVEREFDAGEVLRKANELMSSDKEVMDLAQRMEREKHIPARMHYYYACHYRKENELAKMRARLDKGIEQDPEDADILIALYRDSANSPDRRKQVLEKIRKVSEQFRNEIANSSNDVPANQANSYNQYAWLIANTEGNFDLALQYSHKSLEIMPDEASLLDTLAHCYAAKRDFKNAVHYQSRAVELDPHTMVIQRALSRFKEELEKSEESRD